MQDRLNAPGEVTDKMRSRIDHSAAVQVSLEEL